MSEDKREPFAGVSCVLGKSHGETARELLVEGMKVTLEKMKAEQVAAFEAATCIVSMAKACEVITESERIVFGPENGTVNNVSITCDDLTISEELARVFGKG